MQNARREGAGRNQSPRPPLTGHWKGEDSNLSQTELHWAPLTGGGVSVPLVSVLLNLFPTVGVVITLSIPEAP